MDDFLPSQDNFELMFPDQASYQPERSRFFRPLNSVQFHYEPLEKIAQCQVLRHARIENQGVPMGYGPRPGSAPPVTFSHQELRMKIRIEEAPSWNQNSPPHANILDHAAHARKHGPCTT